MAKFKKIFASVVIAFLIFDLLVISSKNAQAAAFIGDPLEFTKQYIIYPLVRAIANSFESILINKLNQQIIGANGAVPSFITNWRNHLLDSEARGNDVFRSVLADANICGFMSSNIKTAFGADLFAGSIAGATVKDASGKVVYTNETNVPGMASFQESAKCTLPANFDVNAFNQDFSKGGWAAWDQMLEPQNNLFGIYTMALGEQQAQIATEQTSTMNSAVAGNGFLSSKLGNAVGSALGVSGSATGPTGCVDTAGTLSGGVQGPTMTTRCTFMGKDVTPGFLKAGGAGSAIGTKIGQPQAAKEITDVVLSLFNDVLKVVADATGSVGNYLGQASYDATVGSLPGFSETQKQAGASDTQINQVQQQVNQTSAQLGQKESATASAASGTCSSTCMATKATTCTTNNQVTTCNPVTDPVTGQTTQSCQTSTDPTGYNACMAQAQTDCNAQCPVVPTVSIPPPP
ncbi:MAG: hypothetical protein ABR875_00210 [Minisyncoccia bacterium]|jgi:hypothetical protein